MSFCVDIPFENLEGVAVTAKKLVIEIRILCKKYVSFAMFVNMFWQFSTQR